MSEKPEINLRQYKRFNRKVPWSLIRKIVLFSVFGYLVFYGLNEFKFKTDQVSEPKPIDNMEIDVIIDTTISVNY